MTSLAAVLTTIQEPTSCVRTLSTALDRIKVRLIVIGDMKGPNSFPLPTADFYPLATQGDLAFKLAPLLPTGHYSRKNLGYLIAFGRGVGCIYETDDDNSPLPNWKIRTETVTAQKSEPRRWLNVYRLFTNDLIWPRGFPLDAVRASDTYTHDASMALQIVRAPIQQGLANGAPDVDAVWRLMLDHPVDFAPGPSIWLPPRTYCPFNSQSTWWWSVAFPLMYLPNYCSFRMTDIWRGLVAPRCLWELGMGLVFHSAEVNQLRNIHNLMLDFRDEIPGYLDNNRIVDVLNSCSLLPGERKVGDNLRLCYQALSDSLIIPPEEMALVDAWLSDTSAAVQTSYYGQPSAQAEGY